MKDFLKTFLAAHLILIWLFVISVLFAAGYLLVWPKLNNLWIKGFRSSNEYVTTKQHLLLKYVEKWQDLETKIEENQGNDELIKTYQSQQESIVDRVEMESKLLQPEQVPYDVKIFLEKNK